MRPDPVVLASMAGSTDVVGPTASGALADHEIRAAIDDGSLRVTPFDAGMVRPSSLGLRLGRSAYVLRTDGPVDTANPATHPRLVSSDVDEVTPLSVGPGEVVLAPTLEKVALPATMAGLVDGTSEVAPSRLAEHIAIEVRTHSAARRGVERSARAGAASTSTPRSG